MYLKLGAMIVILLFLNGSMSNFSWFESNHCKKNWESSPKELANELDFPILTWNKSSLNHSIPVQSIQYGHIYSIDRNKKHLCQREDLLGYETIIHFDQAIPNDEDYLVVEGYPNQESIYFVNENQNFNKTILLLGYNVHLQYVDSSFSQLKHFTFSYQNGYYYVSFRMQGTQEEIQSEVEHLLQILIFH